MDFDFSWLNESIEEIIDDILHRINEIAGKNGLSREEIMSNVEDLWADRLYIITEKINDHVRDYVFEKIERILERKEII